MVRGNDRRETKANATAYIFSARDVTLTFPCIRAIREFEGLAGAGSLLGMSPSPSPVYLL